MSAQVKNELLALQRASKGGLLHAEQIVAWARKNRRSSLHKQFVWDDRKAANEYRLWQARRLVQIHIVTADGSPMLVNLSIDRHSGGGYRSINEVLSKRELSATMLADALSELERVQARYNRVAALAGVWKEVEKASRKIGIKKAA